MKIRKPKVKRVYRTHAILEDTDRMIEEFVHNSGMSRQGVVDVAVRELYRASFGQPNTPPTGQAAADRSN